MRMCTTAQPSPRPACHPPPPRHPAPPNTHPTPPPAAPAGSFLGVRGRELDEKWDDTGAGACFFLEQEMSDAMTGGAGGRGCKMPLKEGRGM